MSEINESNIEEICEQWMRMSQSLKSMKVQEMEIRKMIVAFLAPDGHPGLSTINFTSIIAKVTIKLNYKFDEILLETLYDSMSEIEKEAIKYKPTLSLSMYKKIHEADRTKLDDTLVVTPAAPTLNIQYRNPEDDDNS